LNVGAKLRTTLEKLREQYAVLCDFLPFNRFHDEIGADPSTMPQAASLIQAAAPTNRWGCAPECSRSCEILGGPSPSMRCLFT
jgi:hypothetical protein